MGDMSRLLDDEIVKYLTFGPQVAVASSGSELPNEALPARSLAAQAWAELFARPEDG